MTTHERADVAAERQASAADPRAIPVWHKNFEGDYWPGAVGPDGPGPHYSRSGKWVDGPEHATTAFAISDEKVWQGPYAYKGWIIKPGDNSHRAYPCEHLDVPGPVVNSFMVWLDCDYARMGEWDWIHFATWANNPNWHVHTMSVLGTGKVEMAHVRDLEYLGDATYPLRRWVRFTTYLHYKPDGDGLVFTWMDGRPIMRAWFDDDQSPSLQRAHWGMYASGAVDS